MRRRRYIKAHSSGRGRHWIEPAVVGAFLVFSIWLMFHTFGYDGKTHTILIASRLWSDFGSHIPLIRSFSMGANLNRILRVQSPEYPIYPGEPIRYHFLFYMVVGILEKTGIPIDWALNIPSAVGFTLLLWGIWSLAKKLFNDSRIAILSVIFFLFNGSLSFLTFFIQHPVSLNTIFDIINANAFPAFGPWDNGTVSAFWNLNIYTNQRHLAWGFAIGIWFLIWILSSKKTIVSAVLWGLAIGILPYLHQPMLLIMAIIMSSSFVFFSRLRLPLLITGSISLILVIPQILTMPRSAMVAWYPGYLIHDHFTLFGFLAFWFQNLGLHAVLIPISFFFFLSRRAKKVLVPLFLIFIVGNFFKFSMEVTANHKFFNFALILGNIVTAYSIITLTRRIGNIGSIGLLVVLVVFLTLSGIIDFFVVFNDSKGTLADVGNDQVATWIAQRTPQDAVFLNSSFLYHPASLAGRSIFMGWPYFAWSGGYDTYQRSSIMKQLYESRNPDVFCPLLRSTGIDYVTVEDTQGDPNLPKIDVKYFLTHFEELSTPHNDGHPISIFKTNTLCPQ